MDEMIRKLRCLLTNIQNFSETIVCTPRRVRIVFTHFSDPFGGNLVSIFDLGLNSYFMLKIGNHFVKFGRNRFMNHMK